MDRGTPQDATIAMHPVPALTTARLVLRGHTPADLAASAAMWADPTVVRHIGGKPSSLEEAWSRLLRYGGLWSLLGYGYWLVEERGSGAFVGEVGFADFRRELEPGFAGASEAGWVLTAAARGRGFAGEAMAEALRWAEAHLPSRRTVCMIAPENTASLRLARACGYAEYARATYRGSPTLLLERA